MNSARALVALVMLAGLTAGLAAQTNAPAKPAPAAPAVKAKAGDKKAAPKAEEKEGKIEGQVIARANGTFLGLTLDGGKFKLAFYDKKKKPMPVDVTRAVARWPNVHGPGDNRTVLNVGGDGKSLLGAQFVRGPYAFRLMITLLQGEGDSTATVETFTVQFNG